MYALIPGALFRILNSSRVNFGWKNYEIGRIRRLMGHEDSLYLVNIQNELKSRYQIDIDKIEQSNKQKIEQFNDLKTQAVELLRPFLDNNRDTVLSYLDDILTGKAARDEWGYDLSMKASKEIQDFFETTHLNVNSQAWAVIEYALREFGLDGNYSRHDEGPYIVLKFDNPQILPREWNP